jgi:hypothetical protein
MSRVFFCLVFSIALVSLSRAAVVYDQPHNGSATLHKSSWYSPNGLDGDAYCWDDFTLASGAAISELHWRGGYELHPSGSGQSPVYDFEVSIYRSIGGNSQPDLGAGGRLVSYFVGANAGEVAAGSFGGVQMYDYAFALPSPFQAAAGTTYWVQIEASQGGAPPSYAPDWGLAVGTGGNNSHFRFTTGSVYQTIANDLALSLYSSGVATVTISASASPAIAGTVTGAGAYPAGSTATLTAIPNPGYGFVNWTEGATQLSTNPIYSFTASANRTLVANFDTAFTVVTFASPPYGGITTGGGVYTNGSTVTVSATPAHGFLFTGWSDGGTTATHSFTVTSGVYLTAFFASAPDAVTFDFDGGPYHASLPLDYTVNGVTAHFTGNYSTQPVGTLGIAPAGMSGWYLYPSSIYQSDLGIGFSEALKDFSILYAPDELACDASARMRVTAYMNGASVGTNTMVAAAGTYPSATLSIAVPAGFNSVVVHWDAPGTLCQDYGPIFFADNVTVTRLVPPVGVGDRLTGGIARLDPPAPNPFRLATTFRFELPRPGAVRLTVFDLSGRRVRTIVDGVVPAGGHGVTWDGVDDAGHRAGAGMYIVRLQTDDARLTRRMLLLK